MLICILNKTSLFIVYIRGYSNSYFQDKTDWSCLASKYVLRSPYSMYSITVYTGSFRVHTPSSFTTFLKIKHIQFVQQYTIKVYTGSLIIQYYTVHRYSPGTYSQQLYNILKNKTYTICTTVYYQSVHRFINYTILHCPQVQSGYILPAALQHS